MSFRQLWELAKMSKILITAFEPFGLIRGKLLNKNASKEVIDLVKDNLIHDANFEIISVNAQGEKLLCDKLNSYKPTGVICMGENLLQHGSSIHIEPYAIDSPVSTLTLGGINKIERSSFAEYAIEKFNQTQDSKIGTYYCNRAYLCSLRWCEANGSRPVVFVHVPVSGSRNVHGKQILKLVSLMKSYLNN